eukprot:CAMPEP_0184395860 /NCGR_PEP_ID=MMETSP0007-20130409/46313_1 /TAXON_ID=97485 /ORGANISM="Prymnesium parvum, Strain Texoma1" /LENGTH=179 /DNA_ID=CAMNT_0026748317 /DNA_START=36 /DNA_END=575 /DNA_ORIENTATION=+
MAPRDDSIPSQSQSPAALPSSDASAPPVAPAHDRDKFREMPVRLLGYANEVGESFRPLVPRWLVNGSYALSGGYVLTDTAWRVATVPGQTALTREAAVEACDTLVWQALASVIVPGALINRVVWAAGRMSRGPRWMPTAVGLGCVPFIVGPIDHGVNYLMDVGVRPFYSKGKESRESSD